MTPPGGSGGFRVAFAALAALAVAPVFAVERLWLVDLPQHEALVAMLRHWNDAACGYPELF